MPIKVYVNNGGGVGEIELTRYVMPGTIKITKTLNQPTVCSLSMAGYDNNFILPVPRSYIRIYSTKNRRTLFTGILTVDPARNFQGLGKTIPGTNFQQYQYNLNYTSDEYLLNIKSVDFIPAYVNQTQGQILKNLAETLAPGYYDTSMVASGDLVPYLKYDSTQNWSDYAKKFCDASRFRYSCQDRQLRFQPYGDGPLGIEYDDSKGEGTFDGAGLSTSALTTQIVNDVTVIGQQEAGDSHEDFFIGTGFDGAFPLKHKVYGLATGFSGSSVLLSDPWTGGQLNTQNWFVQDPAAQFNYAGGGLNIIAGVSMPAGISFIYANNALELAGGVVMQHGELLINDTCTGLIGGIYDDTTMNPATCEAAFQLIPTATVTVTASGASGISIQPFRNGAVPATAFNVISKINKSYTLYTKIAAPVATRTTQIFRSIAGFQFGATATAPTVSGSITWTVLETDQFTGQQTYYYFTQAGVILPDTAIYGLINNQQLNISLSSTSVWTPPPGNLGIQTEIGAGLLAPIYISGNVQYTGAFVTPSGGHLPIELGSNDPVSAAGFGPEQLFDMGSGIGSQAAEIDSGTLTDTLNFYNNALPGVGTRIRLQTWESQAAVSRMRDTVSVTLEAAIVGDDGVRGTTINNLNPLPRRSEDCDNACQSILKDRTGVFYQGTYNCSYLFFKNLDPDIEFYPTCGRYLFVNCPQRNIVNQKFLVTSCTISVTEMAGEILQYSVSFGPDLSLQKLLAILAPQPQTDVLQATDATVQVTPQQLSRVGTYFLNDVLQSSLTGQINGTQAVLALQDTLPTGAVYEIRSADVGTWGQADGTLLYRIPANGNVALGRSQYDQSWYIRMVSGAYIPAGGDNSLFNPTAISQSRRTKVIRVVYPRIPSAPSLMTADTSFVQMDFAGDTRNVEGLEIRLSDDTTVCYQCIVGSRYDLGINMAQLRNKLSPGQPGLTGLGQFLVHPFPSPQYPPGAFSVRDFYAHFFNLMLDYGPALHVNMPAFNGPTVTEGFRWGSALQVKVQITNSADVNRQDVESTIIQICSSPGFSPASSTFIQAQMDGNPGFATVNVPTTGDLYARATFCDMISSGAWSNTLHIPQGDLIASDYLASQGSVPPTITNVNGGSGGIFTYAATSGTILMYSQGFTVVFPNGTSDYVPASSGAFSNTVDNSGAPLSPATPYGFFPAVKGATTANPTINFNGPFLNYGNTLSLAAFSGLFSDGSIPLVNSAFIAQTNAGGSVDYGGGGGSYGGGNCGTIDRLIKLADDSEITLDQLRVGALVKSTLGATLRVKRKVLRKELTYRFWSETGRESRSSLAHTLRKPEEEWCSLEEAIALAEDGEDVLLGVAGGQWEKLARWENTGMDWVIQVELGSIDDKPCDHTYILDGYESHNNIIKSDPSDGS